MILNFLGLNWCTSRNVGRYKTEGDWQQRLCLSIVDEDVIVVRLLFTEE
jgi:hypothetical protein